ncbi:hypothetical protein BDN72DRAFT_839665 [Pluteus cervinus]|uniref:Uncharacterized protein n=1 Tax=Pluteus cervinus TaxID=181527 RepID=A0ACD3AW38_9AGAR|nr:hypothetical protein BDN72DRAFT_839665 [Pluteus cervinus]
MALTSLISEISVKLTILNGRDLDHGHRLTKPSFRAKVVVDGKEFVTKPSANGIWNEDFTITIKAGSQMRLEVICNHKKAKDDHAVGVDDNCDVLGTISNPNAGVIEVGLSRPGREKAVGLIRYTIDVIKTHELRRGTHHQASLSWRTLNSAEIIRKVVFNNAMDDLVPPQWACIISSLDGLVENTKDLAELNSSAKIAVGAVCAAIKLIIDQVERDERVETLTKTMSSIYYHIQDTNFEKIGSFEHTLRRLVNMTTECAYFIASYKKKVFARRTLEGAILGVDDIIGNFEESFSQLRIEFLMGSTLQSTHTVLLVLNEVRNIETLLHLQTLPLIEHAGWGRVQTKLSSQQEAIFDGLTVWAQDPDKRLISLIVSDSCDEASLIAHKLCERFHGQARLGSAVFFPKATGGTELSCKRLISTIARELAALHPTFAETIAAVLAKSPSLALSSARLDRQFEELLIHPLQSLTVVGPVLIVIDGLDRCSDQLKFVETLGASHILGNIPWNIRFLLATSPRSQLLDSVIRLTSSSLRIWRTGAEMQSHIITNSFWRQISKGYQGSQLLDRLGDLEAGMTAVYSAETEIPLTPYPTTTPMSAALLSEISLVVTKGRHAAFLEPLLNQARQCIPPELMTRFESYSCFVSIQASKWNLPFYALFLELKDAVDPEISPWVQEITDTHHLGGTPPTVLELLLKEGPDYPKAPLLVLRYLNMTLTPNICRFEEITKLNKDLEGLNNQLGAHVPPTLRLLSGCWSEWVAPYLQALQEDHRRVALSELRMFLSSHFLSWIELVSLLGCVDAGLKQLQHLEPVLSQMMKGTSTDMDDIGFMHSIISDSIRFMMYFRTPIRDGGLFVHRLAFFASTTTFIHRTYAPENVVRSGLNTNWPYTFGITNVDTLLEVGQASNDAVLTSLYLTGIRVSIKLWSLESGAHLRTFELPDDAIPSYLNKFLALPGKNHFTFMNEGHVSVFESNRSVNDLRQLELEGYAYSVYETSLAIRVQEGHLYFMDLATSEIRTYPSFFPSQERQQQGILEMSPMAQKSQRGILEISPNNGHILTCTPGLSEASGHDSYSAAVEVYDIAYGQAQAVRTLKHSHSEVFWISQLIWSKDQSHMITIIQTTWENSFFYLWDVDTSNYRKLDIGLYGSASFGDDGLVILALETEIRLVNCLTFEVVIAIPLEFPGWGRRIFGHHRLVMTRYNKGLFFHDVTVKSKSPRGFDTGIPGPLPRAYQENVFQNSVKHKLRVQDLELVDGWLVMKPDIKLVWIPVPFDRLVKDKSMDQITISNSPWYSHHIVRLVLDCKAVEKYFL